MTVVTTPEPAVRAVFDAYPPELRAALLNLRQLIFATAVEADVGPLVEALRWGQPAYLTAQPRTGTTIRIDAVKGSTDRYAMYVNCRTTLMESYRQLYPDLLVFEGQRALVLSTAAAGPEAALKHCIALALTYHRSSKA